MKIFEVKNSLQKKIDQEGNLIKKESVFSDGNMFSDLESPLPKVGHEERLTFDLKKKKKRSSFGITIREISENSSSDNNSVKSNKEILKSQKSLKLNDV